MLRGIGIGAAPPMLIPALSSSSTPLFLSLSIKLFLKLSCAEVVHDINKAAKKKNAFNPLLYSVIHIYIPNYLFVKQFHFVHP